MPSKNNSSIRTLTLPQLFTVYGSLFLLWTLYRLFFHTTVFVEETIIKGGIFLLPLLIVPLQEKHLLKTLGITSVNFFQSVYLGITLGLVLGLAGQLGNLIRHQAIIFSNFRLTSANIGAFLILSLITAFWEQLLFSGYFLHQYTRLTSNELVQVASVGMLFSLIHVPALLFVQPSNPSQLILSLTLLFTLGVGCAILRLRQTNLIAPIMAHALWGVSIFLFR